MHASHCRSTTTSSSVRTTHSPTAISRPRLCARDAPATGSHRYCTATSGWACSNACTTERAPSSAGALSITITSNAWYSTAAIDSRHRRSGPGRSRVAICTVMWGPFSATSRRRACRRSTVSAGSAGPTHRGQPLRELRRAQAFGRHVDDTQGDRIAMAAHQDTGPPARYRR